MAHSTVPARAPEAADGLYERDYCDWTVTQARALRARRTHDLDWENLAEEIESLGRSDARALKSHLARLMAHLLKWTLQASKRTQSKRAANSWRGSVNDARREIRDLLDDSPSLKHRLPEFLPKAFAAAIDLAQKEPGLDKSAFPPRCPWTFDRIMDDRFWPGA
ncbi:MAG: DUF29 domain-containing protein [Candidatus Binataceae bacterium]